MSAIRKQFLTDESSRPVAVQIPYEDWLRIERLLGLNVEGQPAHDLSRFAGVLELSEDGLAFQLRMRGEWPE